MGYFLKLVEHSQAYRMVPNLPGYRVNASENKVSFDKNLLFQPWCQKSPIFLYRVTKNPKCFIYSCSRHSGLSILHKLTPGVRSDISRSNYIGTTFKHTFTIGLSIMDN